DNDREDRVERVERVHGAGLGSSRAAARGLGELHFFSKRIPYSPKSFSPRAAKYGTSRANSARRVGAWTSPRRSSKSKKIRPSGRHCGGEWTATPIDWARPV